MGFVSFASAADPSFIFDLKTKTTAPDVLTRVYGRGLDEDGAKGVPVAGGYDCNGDGHLDYAFAQIQGDPLGRIGAGEVTLVFGDGTIGGTINSAIFQSRILRIAGTQSNETTGAEIWMDDVNGDGIGDLLIGRQNHSPSPLRLGTGALTIVFGNPQLKTHAESLSYLDLGSPPAGIKVITFWGVSAYDRLGIWLRTGDITGDGISDVLVGADEVDGVGLPVSDNRGAAYVIRGGVYLNDSPSIIDLADFGSEDFPAAFKGQVAWVDPPLQSADYHFGGTVQLADLDGNHRMEVLVAATLSRSGANLRLPNAPENTGEGSGGSQDGSVFIVWDENFPPGPWPEGYRFSAESPPLGNFTRIDGDPDYTNFGEEMIGGLDFSGDGFPELFVGDLIAGPDNRPVAGIGYILYNAGNLRGRKFRIDTPPPGIFVTSIYGPSIGAIGGDTVSQGDFDGDGNADLAFGNPGDSPEIRTKAGSVHVLYGQPGGWPGLVNLRPDTNGLVDVFPALDIMRIAEIDGAQGTTISNTGDTLSYSGVAADIDRDGLSDLLINEMVGDGVSTLDVGNLIIISGAALFPKPTFNLLPSETGPIVFGSRAIDEGESSVQNISFKNISSNNLTLTTITIEGPNAGDFSIVSQSPGTNLIPDATKLIGVSFNPSSIGYKGAALVIKTNQDSVPIRLGLSGVGTDSSLDSRQLAIEKSGPDIELTFESEISVHYLLQKSDDLSDWSTENLRIGTGVMMNIFEPNAIDETTAGTFYRLLATPGN
ncbi:MAG: hypothetical protein O3C43_22985 [Verrucomicrobia bacterium]|nr:hypothetical protein [Verrucomicrobiota bacterium]